MEVCEYDYGRCLLEIDKIKQFQVGYSKDKQEVKSYDGCFLQLLNAGVIYQPPKDAVFDFVDAILDSKVNLAFNLYHQCLAVNEATMVMISVLYNNAKAVLQVKNCSSRDVEKVTGLTSWQIQCARKHIGALNNHDLINIMRVCQRCQQAIVTGEIDEEFVMDYILVEVL
jgi:DNA polymerase III delta subunit